MNSCCGFPLSLTAISLATTNELEISQLDGFPTWCKVLRLSMKNKNFFSKLQKKNKFTPRRSNCFRDRQNFKILSELSPNSISASRG